MKEFSDGRIIASWSRNVTPWISAVRSGEIESRNLVTNQAIINMVLRQKPVTVLDAGCGEGWLVRELCERGLDCLGIDAIPELVDSARELGGGRFLVMNYGDINVGSVDGCFDAIVCNFSLLGDESVEQLFRRVPCLLNDEGSLIVQTVHPVYTCGEAAYEDGWRQGSWAGFSARFTDPAPWYFRTLESWKTLFSENGLSLKDVVEPVHPASGEPVSIIFVGVKHSDLDIGREDR